MRLRLASTLALALTLAALAPAADPHAALFKDIQAVAQHKTVNSPAARAAWDRLVAAGPAVLPQLLQAMNTPDTVVANWLRTAFDRIVDTELKNGGKQLDTDALLDFARNVKNQGRARRLALDVVFEVKPTTKKALFWFTDMLNDPEFSYEAVEALREKAAITKNPEESRAMLRRAFAACRDVPQAQKLAVDLKADGIAVSLAEHFGFLTDWYLIGPFDGQLKKGFKTVYPPEEKIDLAAKLPGKSGRLEWKRYQAKEATSGLPARVVLVNLTEALGVVEDAVGYAYTKFHVEQEQEVEFRGAGDDNFSVWVNGKKEFAFEEYRNGIRLDRHRFKVKLKAGENTVLVKVVQAPGDPTNNEPNWEFLLRVVDLSGKGISLKSALPK
ncbi:MAG: hypothetical protein JNM56_36525 [Planctomycetia bacterium]|nr:hypothetical protein [Planctomycetia bacterium]